MSLHPRISALLAALACLLMAGGCDRTLSEPKSNGKPKTPGQPLFRDMAAAAGIDFRFAIPGKRPINILQAMGGAAAFLDYDNDGWLDVLLMSQRVALYRNERGRFTDVTSGMGLSGLPSQWWMGCAVGDYDNDGFDDLYLSAYRGGVLLRNRAGKSFADVSAAAGIPAQKWGTACSFGDYDTDGKLDLFIGNYVKFGPNSVQLCKVKATETSCSPTVYEAEKPKLYRNQGGGRFLDVTADLGVLEATGKVLGSIFFDADGSGRQSIYLGNDEVSSDLLLNTGKRFKNVGEEAGVAYTESGKPYGGMGVDYADIDLDGRMDFVVGTFSLENKLVLLNQGKGMFLDLSQQMGIAEPMRPYLTFGTRLFDYDNDGDQDVIFANGYIADNVAEYEPNRTYREPTLLFRNEAGKSFTDMRAEAGPDLRRDIVGRALATGDYDNDGRVDVLVADAEGAPLLLHNETPGPGSYLSIRLVGGKSNRNGYGAIVTVEADGKKQVHVCHSDGSYLAASDSRIHAGLGAAKSAKVTVRWPAGGTDTLTVDRLNRRVTIHEGRSR